MQDTLKADINDSFLLTAHTCSAYAQRVTELLLMNTAHNQYSCIQYYVYEYKPRLFFKYIDNDCNRKTSDPYLCFCGLSKTIV